MTKGHRQIAHCAKGLSLFLSLLFAASCCNAQDTREITTRLTNSVKEIYHVMKTDKNVMHGLYQAVYKERQPVATGLYNHDKRSGIWRFYDAAGQPMQTYDYDTNTVTFEAKEDTTSNFRYLLDKTLGPADKAHKPVITGGRYFGYLNYLKLFKLPAEYESHPEVTLNEVKTTLELLVSPGGRLADIKVNINNGAEDHYIRLKADLLPPEDKVFTPATLNGEPVACRIIIRVYITEDGGIDFY